MMSAVLYIVLLFSQLYTAPSVALSSEAEMSARCSLLGRENCLPRICSWSHGNGHSLDCVWSNGSCTAYSSAANNDRLQTMVNSNSNVDGKWELGDRKLSSAFFSSSDPIANSDSRKLLSAMDSDIFVNFLPHHYVATKLHNWANCDVKRTDEPRHTVHYVGLTFNNEVIPCCCHPSPQCDIDSQVVIQDENADDVIFCFSASSRLRTQKWSNNKTWFELSYNNALRCCSSDSRTESHNGNITLILRITLSPNVTTTRVESVSNYNSLLSCNSKSDPVVIDVIYRSSVEHIQYIDLQNSKFECNSSRASPGLDPHLVPVSSTVTCRLHSVRCLNDPGYTLDTCVNEAAKNYLTLEATTEGSQCVEWTDAFSKSAVQLESGAFVWESQAITTAVDDAKCSFRFRSVMTCPGSEMHQNETAAVELRAAFNCSATTLQCGYPERGTCNHTSLRCQCKETCGLLKIYYGGEQCEEDPWCKTDIAWIAIAIGSTAFLFSIVACIINACCGDKLAKRCKCCKCCSKERREGYQHSEEA